MYIPHPIFIPAGTTGLFRATGDHLPLFVGEGQIREKTYLNYLVRRSYQEVSEDLFQHVDRENHWIGPGDLFLEYEIHEEYTREKDGITEEIENTYQCLVWFISKESGVSLAIRTLSDKFRAGEREWDGKTDTMWRPLGPLSHTRNYNRLLELYYTLPEAALYKDPPVTFPLLIDLKNDGNKTYLYELKEHAPSTISESGYMEVNGKQRKIMSYDLFLEYEILDDISGLTTGGVVTSGNLYRCIACFTNRGGRNSEIMIRVLSDNYWGEGKEPEGETDETWRHVGYLDEIPTFRKIVDAFRKYVEPETFWE